ncbi:GTP-binding protein [Peptostreptococcus equinus]|uniref:GTP-binding protein n=1 Tax=Peptostreptococcus equinus TaxID=3003601 RepID=A0ABY7JND4_9FIRM|nr:GTP-binding protein [Peptostreptococcus sp. CBA3647]WAW14876.1 GTP-binding protein [Peptostreptococcus sp. CBA3647]
MTKTKINIISGFLGAGKTSFIKKIIDESKDFNKIAIIENEFGEVSIDGPILEAIGVNVKEINAGCICCSVAGNFSKSLLDIKKNYAPENILVEPSGIAKLSDIKDICMEKKDLFEFGIIVTVVDISKFDMYLKNFGEFYENQIKNSNTIVFSRYQKAIEKKLDIDKILEKIRIINPKLNIVNSEWDNFEISSILPCNKLSMFSPNIHTHYHEPGESCSCHENHDLNSDFESITLNTDLEMDENKLENIFNEIENSSDLGNLLRSKGSFKSNNKSLSYDYNSGELEFRFTDKKTEHYVILIGENLNEEKLSSMFI